MLRGLAPWMLGAAEQRRGLGGAPRLAIDARGQARERGTPLRVARVAGDTVALVLAAGPFKRAEAAAGEPWPLYTSDAAEERQCVDLECHRNIKKKKN